jgi:hypothetical protein
VPRDADKLLLPAVKAAVSALTLQEQDDALVKLAQAYAAAIDTDADGDALEKLGPKLLAALQALQATPAARARRKGTGGGDRAGEGRLQALRAARRA